MEIGFGTQKAPVLRPKQKQGLSDVSFYLSFFGVAIVYLLLALVVYPLEEYLQPSYWHSEAIQILSIQW